MGTDELEEEEEGQEGGVHGNISETYISETNYLKAKEDSNCQDYDY